MTKRKFRVRVERVDEYEIEVDESVMNEDWKEDFRNYFYDFYKTEEHVEHIAQSRARFNHTNLYGGFIEGYGDIALHGEVAPNSRAPFSAVNITKSNEDDPHNLDIELEEVTNNQNEEG